MRVNEVSPLILKSSAKYGVPSPLVFAVADVESGFRSVKRMEPTVGEYAYGPMQILCSTARDMGYTGRCDDLIKPELSIEYGTKYLAYQIRRYNGNLVQAISAYNAGSYTPANMDYVNKVLDRMEYWARRLGG